VTVDQFQRAISKNNMTNLVSRNGWAAIHKKYSANDNKRDGNRFINYMEFVREIEPKANSKLGSIGASLVSSPKRYASRSADQIVFDAGQACKQKQIRIKEFFTDYDGLRRKVCTKTQFIRALDLAKIKPESVQEQEALIAKFATPDGREVHYHDFSDAVEKATNVAGLEANPEVDVNATIAAFDNEDFFSSFVQPADEAAAREILREVAVICDTQKKELVPYFQDYDYNNNGCVSHSVFQRVINARNLELDDEQIQKLSKVFEAAHTLGQAAQRPDVDYKAFCTAVEKFSDNDGIPDSRKFRKATRNRQATFSSTVTRRANRAVKGVDVMDVLNNMRELTARQNKRPKEFFCESDTLRSGEITRAKFNTALSQLNLNLEADEIAALVDYFKGDRKPDQVNWRKLVDELEGQVRLEDKPDCTPRVVNQSIFRNQVSDQRTLEQALNRISTECQNKRLYLKPSFKDFDKCNARKVLKTNFIKVLDNQQVKHRAELSENDIELICSKYEVVSSKGVGSNWINYHEFVQAVDKTEIC